MRWFRFQRMSFRLSCAIYGRSISVRHRRFARRRHRHPWLWHDYIFFVVSVHPSDRAEQRVQERDGPAPKGPATVRRASGLCLRAIYFIRPPTRVWQSVQQLCVCLARRSGGRRRKLWSDGRCHEHHLRRDQFRASGRFELCDFHALEQRWVHLCDPGNWADDFLRLFVRGKRRSERRRHRHAAPLQL